MKNFSISNDIVPVGQFKTGLAKYLKEIQSKKNSLIITQNGKSAAILLAVSEYEAMVDKIEVLEDIKLAEAQIGKGLQISHQDVKKRFAKRS